MRTLGLIALASAAALGCAHDRDAVLAVPIQDAKELHQPRFAEPLLAPQRDVAEVNGLRPQHDLDVVDGPGAPVPLR